MNNFLTTVKNSILNYYNRLVDFFLNFLKKINNIFKISPKEIPQSNPQPPLKKDEKFITDSRSALIDEISPASNKIIFSIVLFILIGGIWAYFGIIEQTITGHGVVIPSSHVKIIQSLDGGIIEEMYVKEGQMVEKDQRLLKLDDTRYKAEYQQLYEQYLFLLATISRLLAETQDKDQIIFPAELKNKQELMETQKKLLYTRRKSLSDEIEILKRSYELANKEVSMYRPLISTGGASELELLRAQRSANELQTRMYEKEGKFREDAWTELDKRQGELSITRERLLGLKDKMIRTLLTSPVHGIIKKINIVTIGAVVQPAVNIMEIVPLEDTLLVQVKVSSADIAFVYIGAPATVKIDAYDYSIYGDIQGKVEYISADIIEEPPERGYARQATLNAYYLVNIRTAKDYLLHHNEKLPIIPGMTATAQIRVGKRTLMQYILKPLIKAKSEALRER